MEVRYGPDGLVPAIVQDRLTGHVRMVGYMNEAALQRTLEVGRATFYSRSRQELWEKGETSGNGLHVVRVVADCDADALLVLADPTGPTCHTGSRSCFVHPLGPGGSPEAATLDVGPLLDELEREIEARVSADAAKSYTRALLDGGAETIGAKLREEAGELALAIASESDDRVANEAADVLYHLLVGLRSRRVPLRDVLAVLAARAGTSGLAEKAARRDATGDPKDPNR